MTRPGVEVLPSGDERGLDPREMSYEGLEALGFERMSPLRALRLRCIDCCVGSPSEVRACVALTCPAWPFRMGKNPWRAERDLTDEQRAAIATRLSAYRKGVAASDALQDSDDFE